MTSEQALFALQMFLPTVENEQKTTLKILQAVPADKADYKPDSSSMSAFDLSWHIAASEHRFLSCIAAGAFEFPTIDKPKTMAEVIAFYQERCAQNLAALKKLTGEQAAKIMDFRGMFQMPAAAFVMFNNNHIVHHRGQLSAYLRPMGAKVPAIYGESYDSAAAKAANS